MGVLHAVMSLYRYHDAKESKNILTMKLTETWVVEGVLRLEETAITRQEREYCRGEAAEVL